MSRELIDQQKMTEQEVLDTLLEWWLPDNRNDMPGILNIDIQIVEDIEIYTKQSINKEIQQACIDVLKIQQSRDDFIECNINGVTIHTFGRYCEVEKVFEIGKYNDMTGYNKIALGDHNKVGLDPDQIRQMMKMPAGQLIKVHNHPNNSGFQLQDFKQFINISQIAQTVVVGNHGKVFIASKRQWFDKQQAKIELNKLLMNGVHNSNIGDIRQWLNLTKQCGIKIGAYNYRMVTKKDLIDYDKLDHSLPSKEEVEQGMRLYNIGVLYDSDGNIEKYFRVKYFKDAAEYIKIRNETASKIENNEPVDPEIEDRLKKEFKHLIETNQL